MVTGPGDGLEAAGRGHLRASYADREQVVGTLKAAFVQGRRGPMRSWTRLPPTSPPGRP